jgi:hypothetical protein
MKNTKNVNDAARDAVFVRQLNTENAILYVKRIARVSDEIAAEAVKNAPTWYKTASSSSSK